MGNTKEQEANCPQTGQPDYISKLQERNAEWASRTGRLPLAKIITYGCQQNASDSELIKGLLYEMGYGFTEDVEQADLAIFNTCAVREHAELRVYGNIGALKKIKEHRPDMTIAVCGCMAQQSAVAEKIKRSYPYVDLVFGTRALPELPRLLFEAASSRIFELGGEDAVTEGLPVRRDSRFKVWLPVMYGCNNFCTYCIVPYVRGRERSRSLQAVLGEAKQLIENGARDITLLGQNVNSYGKDLDGGVNFSWLLREICDLPGDFLIRFMTSHPKDATEELFETMAACNKAARHLHLPFQSGSSRILKQMNRGYTREQYLELIQKVKNRMPDIALSSDIIVGFPGETYADFKETLEVVRTVEFDNLYTFIYSKRSGTPAAQMDDPVPYAEKTKWLAELIAAQEDITSRHMEGYLGKTVRVLCESSGEGAVFGHTGKNVAVRFPGEQDLIGRFVNIQVTQANRTVLTGIIVE